MDVTKKAMATNFVYFSSMASMVRPLFFPKKVSAPPEMVPLRPADLPDCKSTMAIKEIQNIKCTIVIKISTALNSTPPNHSSVITASSILTHG